VVCNPVSKKGSRLLAGAIAGRKIDSTAAKVVIAKPFRPSDSLCTNRCSHEATGCFMMCEPTKLQVRFLSVNLTPDSEKAKKKRYSHCLSNWRTEFEITIANFEHLRYACFAD
jgi:hypothetical protein